MTSAEVAWLAGLLEGEGCFTTRPTHGRKTPMVRVLMTDRDVIDRAARLMGADRVFELQDKRPNRKRTHQARIYGDNARNLMRILLPHMGERRKARINELLIEECGSTREL